MGRNQGVAYQGYAIYHLAIAAAALAKVLFVGVLPDVEVGTG
jgi:hypothetical protein